MKKCKVIDKLYVDLSLVLKNITKDSTYNDKGFPNKLNYLTDNDIQILTYWIDYVYLTENTLLALETKEFDYEYTTDEFILYITFYILQNVIREFLTEYSNIKKRNGLYMKTKPCIPNIYLK